MDRETFNHTYENELTPKQKKVLPLFLDGRSDDDIIRELNASDRTLITQHLKNICKKFCIYPEKDTDYRNTLVELFWKNKPEIVNPERLKMTGLIAGKPSFPDSPIRADSPFYIERPPIELECYNRLTEVGTLLRIKSPQKMGKTSLLRKIIAEANQKQYYTVVLDLSLLEAAKFTSTEQFLQSFYHYIVQELPSVPPLKEWDRNTSAIINCTKDFQNLLKHLGKVLVLVLDEVDQLFEYPEIYQDFFPMLRHWYEKINTSETWENLRLVIAHSTDDYGRLDIHQSPFNVGIPIKLEEFNTEQVQNLASRHGLGRESILPLIDLVGGHPYLLRLAFYHLYYQHISLQQLMNEINTDMSIYGEHLRPLLKKLENNLELKGVFKKIAQSNVNELKNKTIQMYQLESMGLIKFENNSVKVRCRLYQQYFCDRL